MLTLRKSQMVPALVTNGWHQIQFTNGYMLRWPYQIEHKYLLFQKWTREEIKNCTLHLFNHGEQEDSGNLHRLYPKIKNFNPICSWCRNISATKVLLDGLLVCDECFTQADVYYHCEICNDLLKPEMASWSRFKLEKMICSKPECQMKKDIKLGRLCCEKAEKIGCVCAYAYKCPEHAPNGVHVGTHD